MEAIGVKAPGGGQGSHVRVATYNIRHAAPPGGRADVARMGRAVADLGADVVALQEVDRHVVRSGLRDQARVAGRAAGLTHHFAAARTLGPFGRYGVALLLPSGPHQLRVHRLESLGEARVALFGRVRVGATTLTVVCTHLQNSSGGRAGEAPAQLDELLDELARWPEPWVLMGDLNLRADAVLPRFEAAGLLAAATGPTFPADDPAVRIDWIGVRGLHPTGAHVLPVPGSDHLPVVADLVVPSDGARPAPEGPQFGPAAAERR